jgi:hypothetical protein
MIKSDIDDIAINIIIDDTDAQNQIFVEIENDNGESIRIGSDSKTECGLTKIRISVSDIVNNLKT